MQGRASAGSHGRKPSIPLSFSLAQYTVILVEYQSIHLSSQPASQPATQPYRPQWRGGLQDKQGKQGKLSRGGKRPVLPPWPALLLQHSMNSTVQYNSQESRAPPTLQAILPASLPRPPSECRNYRHVTMSIWDSTKQAGASFSPRVVPLANS